jgi:hypothetical protein
MKKQERLKAIELRKQGMSLKAIAEQLAVTKGSVIRWVRAVQLTADQIAHLGISRAERTGSLIQARALKLRAGYGQLGRELATHSDSTYAMGCMLFWAEGSKDRNTVCFTNTDVDMMVFFVNFLRKYFSCEALDFSVRLNAYIDNGLSSTEIEDYWLRHLSLPRSCLRKSIFKRGTGAGGKHTHGVCTLRVCKTRIAQMLYGSIQQLTGVDKRVDWVTLL